MQLNIYILYYNIFILYTYKYKYSEIHLFSLALSLRQAILSTSKKTTGLLKQQLGLEHKLIIRHPPLSHISAMNELKPIPLVVCVCVCEEHIPLVCSVCVCVCEEHIPLVVCVCVRSTSPCRYVVCV